MLQEQGNLEYASMFEYFNMGIGLVLSVGKDDVQKVMDALKTAGEQVFVIGCVEKADSIEHGSSAYLQDRPQIVIDAKTSEEH